MGCDDYSTYDSIKDFNGTWIDTTDNFMVFKIDNGVISYYEYGELAVKYAMNLYAKHNLVTLKITHMHGSFFDIEERLYTIAEIKKILDFTDEELWYELWTDDIRYEYTYMYSLSGNSLILDDSIKGTKPATLRRQLP